MTDNWLSSSTYVTSFASYVGELEQEYVFIYKTSFFISRLCRLIAILSILSYCGLWANLGIRCKARFRWDEKFSYLYFGTFHLRFRVSVSSQSVQSIKRYLNLKWPSSKILWQPTLNSVFGRWRCAFDVIVSIAVLRFSAKEWTSLMSAWIVS